MLEQERPDVVFISGPGSLHSKLTIDAIDAGAHVFVEKPLGWTSAEAQDVATKAETAGKKVSVGFMKRFAPAYVRTKKIIADQEKFGKVLSMTGMFGIRSFGPKVEPYIKFGAIHYIDLIRYYFGEVTDLFGFQRTPSDGVNLLFSFATKKQLIGNMFFAGLPSWARHHEEVMITGTKGFVKTQNMREVIFHHHEVSSTTVPRWQTLDEIETNYQSIDTSSSGGWQNLFLNGYVGEVQAFLENVMNDTPVENSADNNVKTMQLCELILDQMVDPTI